MMLLLLACTGAGATKHGDSEAPAAPVGPLLLCGGGTEGETEDADAWSVAYGALTAVGDIDGDGQMTVVVLATGEETEWVPEYFEFLGADDAYNLQIDSISAANDPEVVGQLQTADAIFLKGGDQGEYYDLWNDTGVESAIVDLHTRGGVIGGTSAGAMSQSEYALAGSNDYVTADVLADSHTPWLDDVSDGGTGIHTDFLGLLPGVLVDTHFSTRARLGRLAGAMARAIDDGAPAALLGIGLDEQTCLTVSNGRGRVSGVGSVVFLRAGDEAALRVEGEPLVWAGLALDRLTDGWAWTFDTAEPDAADAAAETVSWDGSLSTPSSGTWAADGRERSDEEHFALVAERWPSPYVVRGGSGDPLLTDSVAMLDALDSDMRGVNDEVLFRTLYDHLGATGFLVGDGARMERDASTPNVVALTGAGDTPLSTMVIDAGGTTARSLSPWPSQQDAGDGALHAAGLVGMRLSILYTDGADGRAWDCAARAPVAAR